MLRCAKLTSLAGGVGRVGTRLSIARGFNNIKDRIRMEREARLNKLGSTLVTSTSQGMTMFSQNSKRSEM